MKIELTEGFDRYKNCGPRATIGCIGHDGDCCKDRDAEKIDAARYRWLRKQKASDGGYWVAHGRINGGLSQWYGDPLDTAIDAAMLMSADF